MLRVEYEVADLEPGQFVKIEERRGVVVIQLERAADATELAAALNPAIEAFLAGGQWFQLWKGEIVTMDSPADPRQGGTVARIHRGPVVHEAS